MNNQAKVWTVVIVIVVGILAFYGGVSYEKGKTPVVAATGTGTRTGAAGGYAGRAGRAGGAAGNFVTGTILSATSGSMTISIPTGGSKIVLFSPSSQIMKATTGSTSDLTTGSNVVVSGTTNSDGSVTATNISIRPAGSTLPGGAGAGNASGAAGTGTGMAPNMNTAPAQGQ